MHAHARFVGLRRHRRPAPVCTVFLLPASCSCCYVSALPPALHAHCFSFDPTARHEEAWGTSRHGWRVAAVVAVTAGPAWSLAELPIANAPSCSHLRRPHKPFAACGPLPTRRIVAWLPTVNTLAAHTDRSTEADGGPAAVERATRALPLRHMWDCSALLLPLPPAAHADPPKPTANFFLPSQHADGSMRVD